MIINKKILKIIEIIINGNKILAIVFARFKLAIKIIKVEILLT